MASRPWMLGNIPGPKMANVLAPKVAAALIKNAKNPLLIVGGQISQKVGGGVLIDYVLRIAEKKAIPIVATADAVNKFVERGVETAYTMGLVEVVDRLRDGNWSINNKGVHDIVVFVGIKYYFESQVLSTLKNFVPHLKAITLDPYFHPNAEFSFPNMKSEEWEKSLNEVIGSI